MSSWREKAAGRHRARYEGWKNDTGTHVQRFDKQDFRWVNLTVSQIPAEIVTDRRQ